MSHLWRILNPALTPPQVVLECGDEQAALREFAARAHGHTLVKSEDNGTSWVGVEARALAAASVPVAVEVRTSAPVADHPGAKVERGEREQEDFARLARDESHTDKASKKASK